MARTQRREEGSWLGETWSKIRQRRRQKPEQAWPLKLF